MPIQELRIGDRTVRVEVVGPTSIDANGALVDPNVDEERGGVAFEPVGRPSLQDIGSQIESTLQGLLPPIAKALGSLGDPGPKEWTVEISLGFKGAAGVPFVVSGEASGAVKVAAKWGR